MKDGGKVVIQLVQKVIDDNDDDDDKDDDGDDRNTNDTTGLLNFYRRFFTNKTLNTK